MKRRIEIIVDIDSDTPGDTQMTVYPAMPDYFEIRVRAESAGSSFTKTKYLEHVSLAHELGHFIGHIYGLTAARQDPRNLHGDYLRNCYQQLSPPSPEELIVASEREAWDMAELILDLDKARQEGVRSYERFYGLPFRDMRNLYTEVK